MSDWKGQIVVYTPGNNRLDDPPLHIAWPWDKEANGYRTLCNRTLRFASSSAEPWPEERHCAICARRGDFAAVRAAWAAQRKAQQDQYALRLQEAAREARLRRPILGRLRAAVLQYLQQAYGPEAAAPRTDNIIVVQYDGARFEIEIR